MSAWRAAVRHSAVTTSLATAAGAVLRSVGTSRVLAASAAIGPGAGRAAVALAGGAYAAVVLTLTLFGGGPPQAWLIGTGAAVAALAALLHLRASGSEDAVQAAGVLAGPALLLGAAAGAALMLRTTPIGPFLGLAVMLALGLLLVQRLARADAALLAVLAAALLARFAFVGADAILDLFPWPDVMGYHYRSAALAESWWTGEPFEAMENLKTSAYEAAIAPAYVLFGASSLVGRAVNILFALLATYNVYRIGRHLFSRPAGLAAALAFALLPSMLETHTEHQREALIALLVTEAAYLLVATRFWEPRPLLVLAACLVPMVFLRRLTLLLFGAPLLVLGAALALGTVAFAAHLARRGVARGPAPLLARREPPVVTTALVLLAALAALAGAVALVGVPGVLYEDFANPEALEVARANWSGGGTEFSTRVAYTSWLDVVLFAPLGAAYFLLSPLPWQVHNLFTLAGVAENLVLFYPLVLLALPGAWAARRSPPALALLAFLAAGVVVYGLVEGNAGTALRHRAQFTWILFVLAGPALAALVARASPRAAPLGASPTAAPETAA